MEQGSRGEGRKGREGGRGEKEESVGRKEGRR